jgi:nucleoside phosphorylase
MCGICAGNKKDAALGDVIIADRVYHYEYGKLVAWRNEAGQRFEELYHDLKTYNLEDSWRVHAEEFAHQPDWTGKLIEQRPLSREVQQHWLLRTLLEYEQKGQEPPYDFGGPERERYCPDFAALWDRLRQPEPGLLEATGGKPRLTEKGRAHAIEWMFKHPKALPRERDFRIHIGTIATGSVVQKDPELFGRLERLIRKTLGAEMEAMAIGLAGEQGQLKSLVVKAVSDYGDGDKDDRFREFAARASAEVLLRFLLQELEPSAQEAEDSPERHSPDGFSAVHGDAPRHDDLLSRVQKITELRVQVLGPLPAVPSPLPLPQRDPGRLLLPPVSKPSPSP